MNKEKIAAVCAGIFLLIVIAKVQNHEEFKGQWARFTLAQPNWEKMSDDQRQRAFDYFVKHDKPQTSEDKGFKSEVMRRLYPDGFAKGGDK